MDLNPLQLRTPVFESPFPGARFERLDDDPEPHRPGRRFARDGLLVIDPEPFMRGVRIALEVYFRRFTDINTGRTVRKRHGDRDDLASIHPGEAPAAPADHGGRSDRDA